MIDVRGLFAYVRESGIENTRECVCVTGVNYKWVEKITQ